MDRKRLPAVSGVRRLFGTRVLGRFLWARLQGAARRGVLDRPDRLSQHVQELGLPDQAADLRWFPHRSHPGSRLMCRHFAYVGDEVSVKSVLFDPPHGLVQQAWAPRWQRHGTMNVDGFGVGWYSGGDPVPARYRRTGPIWAEDCLADRARVTRTGAMLCAVGSASVGPCIGPSAVAPSSARRWRFSL